MFSMSFDIPSLEALVRLKGMSILLDEEITLALSEAGKMLAEAAQANTWKVFSHPSGALAGTIYPWMSSPREMDVRVDSPYGRRQELGGGGGLDVLGRRMTNPPRPYLRPALEEHLPDVETIVETAIQRVLDRVTGGR